MKYIVWNAKSKIDMEMEIHNIISPCTCLSPFFYPFFFLSLGLRFGLVPFFFTQSRYFFFSFSVNVLSLSLVFFLTLCSIIFIPISQAEKYIEEKNEN